MRAQRRALVIGGSIGGLFAAHALRGIGWEVEVFERVGDDLVSRGAGIGTHDELRNVLRRLGLTADESTGVLVRTRVCLNRSGQVVHRLKQPQMQSSWGRIYRLLKDALPADHYHFGMSLERLRQEPERVVAEFADGSRVSGELLVAADGVRSTVREQLFPDARPRYAGYVAWRGLLEEHELPPTIHAELIDRYTMCLPEGEMMLAYPVPGRDNETAPGRRGYNHIWYHPTDFASTLPRLCTDASGHCHGVAIPPPLIRSEEVAAIKALARELFAPQISAVVDQTRQMFFQAVFDVESPRMAEGRVALLGDAAFVARPHVGMGTTKAAIEAEALATCIAAADGDLDAALGRYDAECRPFATRIVARARGLGAYIEAQLKPPAERTAADRQPAPDYLLREIGSNSVDLTVSRA